MECIHRAKNIFNIDGGIMKLPPLVGAIDDFGGFGLFPPLEKVDSEVEDDDFAGVTSLPIVS